MHPSSMGSTAPLSSLRWVPATEDSTAKLRAAGIEPPPGLSEHCAQALLAVHEDVHGDETGAPTCYQAAYNPEATLCLGCVHAPRCWRSDLAYLHKINAGEAPPPPGVPDQVVADRVAHAQARKPAAPPPTLAPPTPLTQRRPPPPPPPRRGGT